MTVATFRRPTPAVQPRREQFELLRRLGCRLREQREFLELTQPELARRAGVSVGTVSLIERGLTSPSLLVLVRLAEPMDLYAFELMAFAELDDLETGG